MNNTLRQTRLKGWFEFYREVCPICGKSGGCMINESGDTAVCIRVESKVVFSKNFRSWVHKLDKGKTVKHVPSANSIVTHPKATPEVLDMVYKIMQNCLDLTEQHYVHLTNAARAMTAEEVAIREYRSFPEKTFEFMKKLLPSSTMKLPPGIPGFYKKGEQWMFNGFPGIMLPFRNQYNQIVGYQIRVDKPKNDVVIDRGDIEFLEAQIKQPDQVQIYLNGEKVVEKKMAIGDIETIHDGMNVGTVKVVTGQRYFWLSSGNKNEGTGAGAPLPIHVAVSSTKLKQWKLESEQKNMHVLHQADSVWVTEGPLKADISAEHIEKVYSTEELKELGSTVLAVPGVNTWKNVLPMLKDMNVKRVNIAFDMDAMSNDDVRYHMKQFIIELKNTGYEVFLAVWNLEDGKGLDDVFVNKKFPQLRKF